MSTHYDALVIGSGQGGTPLSIAFAEANQKTALIESTHVGGCCVNEGCTPTKTMIASGRVAYLSRRGPHYGVCFGSESRDTNAAANDVHVAMETVRQRKRNMVASFRRASERKIREAGVELISGLGSFKDERTIQIRCHDGTKRTLTADRFFICSGDRPATPRIEGFDAASFPSNAILDSTSIQELGTIPSHLVVIGGGYIGLEFGQLFRRLGATVTIVHHGAHLLSREDPDVAQAMLDILQEDGVRICLETTTTKVSATGNQEPTATPIIVSISTLRDGRSSDLLASHILFAAGRVPNTDALNLDAAGIHTTPRGNIIADTQLRTTNPRVWALGDVKGGPAFTHVSYDDFRLLRANLLGDGTSKTAHTTVDRILPYVVYTDPQLGHVGLQESEARAKFPANDIKVAKMPMSYVARALETDEPRGVMKAVVNAKSQQILGFTCLGLDGGEIMSIVQMAMIGGIKWPALRDAVWAHPSLAESLNNLWNFLK